MAGFLFILVIDYVMQQATTGARRGIQWKLTNCLEDLDYADDFVLCSRVHIQEKTTTLEHAINRVALLFVVTNSTRNGVIFIHVSS